MEKKTYGVGALAKKFGVSVRTLQYYDREGLISPSEKSEGNRRLYTDEDAMRLYQVLSFKMLGLPLTDIQKIMQKNDDPEDIVKLLAAQKQTAQAQIADLNTALLAIEALEKEMNNCLTPDLQKYADIIQMLKVTGKNYWIVGALGTELMTHIRRRFSDAEKGLDLYAEFIALCTEAERLQSIGQKGDSPAGQDLAKRWWDMVTAFTGGDPALLPRLEAFEKNRAAWDESTRKIYEAGLDFIQPALGIYLVNNNIPIPGLEEQA